MVAVFAAALIAQPLRNEVRLREIPVLDPPPYNSVRMVEFDRSGRHLFVFGLGNFISGDVRPPNWLMVVDVASGRNTRVFEPHRGTWSLLGLANGTLGTTGADGRFNIWRVDGGLTQTYEVERPGWSFEVRERGDGTFIAARGHQLRRLGPGPAVKDLARVPEGLFYVNASLLPVSENEVLLAAGRGTLGNKEDGDGHGNGIWSFNLAKNTWTQVARPLPLMKGSRGFALLAKAPSRNVVALAESEFERSGRIWTTEGTARRVWFWDLAAKKRLNVVVNRSIQPTKLFFAADDTLVAATDEGILVASGASYENVRQISLPGKVHDIVWVPRLNLVAAAVTTSALQSIVVLLRVDGSVVAQSPPLGQVRPSALMDLAVSPGSARLALARDSQVVLLAIEP